MSGSAILLLISGLSTGLGIGFAAWGWRTRRFGAIFLGAGMLLQGLVVLAFYVVWARSAWRP